MNKKGWGLRAELGFLLLFLICLLVATIGLHKMGIFGSGNTNIISTEKGSSVNYANLENKVSESAKRYYESNYPNGSNDTVIVSIDTLKSAGYLSPIYDNLNRECKGYAKILPSKICVSYIRCGFYKTTGYSEDYE
jgi:hypothetical protein